MTFVFHSILPKRYFIYTKLEKFSVFDSNADSSRTGLVWTTRKFSKEVSGFLLTVWACGLWFMASTLRCDSKPDVDHVESPLLLCLRTTPSGVVCFEELTNQRYSHSFIFQICNSDLSAKSKFSRWRIVGSNWALKYIWFLAFCSNEKCFLLPWQASVRTK